MTVIFFLFLVNSVLLGRYDTAVVSVFLSRILLLPSMPSSLVREITRVSCSGVSFLLSQSEPGGQAPPTGLGPLGQMARVYFLSGLGVLVLRDIVRYSQWGQLWLAPRIAWAGIEPAAILASLALSLIGQAAGLLADAPFFVLRDAGADVQKRVRQLACLLSQMVLVVLLPLGAACEAPRQPVFLGFCVLAHGLAQLFAAAYFYRRPPRSSGGPTPPSQAIVASSDGSDCVQVDLKPRFPPLLSLWRGGSLWPALSGGELELCLVRWLRCSPYSFMLLLTLEDISLTAACVLPLAAAGFASRVDFSFASIFAASRAGLGSTPDVAAEIRAEELAEIDAQLSHPEARRPGLPAVTDTVGLNRYIELDSLSCILHHARGVGSIFWILAATSEPFYLVLGGKHWVDGGVHTIVEILLLRLSVFVQSQTLEAYLAEAAPSRALSLSMQRMLLAAEIVPDCLFLAANRSPGAYGLSVCTISSQLLRIVVATFFVCKRLGFSCLLRLLPSPLETLALFIANAMVSLSYYYIYLREARDMLVSSLLDDTVLARSLDILANRPLLLHVFITLVSSLIPFAASAFENQRTLKRL